MKFHFLLDKEYYRVRFSYETFFFESDNSCEFFKHFTPISLHEKNIEYFLCHMKTTEYKRIWSIIWTSKMRLAFET